MKRILKAALMGGLMLLCYSAAAVDLGQKLNQFSLEDQFGQAHLVDISSATLLFTDSRSAGEVVSAVMQQLPLVEQQRLTYVIDISEMPSMITRFFALPKMKKMPFIMLLDRDGDVTSSFPRREDQVTLMCISNGKLSDLQFYQQQQQLQQALLQPQCERLAAN
ncbi:hypothetical protein [Ferrimonas lipolytica]|uniref:FAD/FMN-containing dehydrogenase n=1 Tax=Ferrimonas lipolytica TaxID=2724191 RepID=A0A6H1UAC8_9GAMM|nr:hypothetical protein [Ferrimonas lipolytica]QIZ76015.1 hypothetical protein HER31_03410 [Ferrimonas lipolytica]